MKEKQTINKTQIYASKLLRILGENKIRETKYGSIIIMIIFLIISIIVYFIYKKTS